LGQLAAKLAGAPIIINTVHGFYFHDRSPAASKWFFILCEKIAGFFSSKILFQSAEDLQSARRYRIGREKALFYLGNGIDLDRFNPKSISCEESLSLRESLGIPIGYFIVGFVGRLVKEKGLIELFEAARIVHEKIPHVRFLFVGQVDSEKKDALTPGVAVDKGVSSICHFIGKRDDMNKLYSLMDVFVLPSHREGLPRAPMEASAMGVPCIATNIRGCREVVVHCFNGLLVSVNDPKALADSILRILNDSILADKMSDEGRKMALERFDERKVHCRVKSEYAALLKEHDIKVPNQGTGETVLAKLI
jgi:glycosyltransferase involved in cell wall biosynthesis